MDSLCKLTIINNKEIDIDNLTKVKSFNSEEFILTTQMGLITIKGHNLEMANINTNTNKITITGEIINLHFGEHDHKKKNNDPFIKKLFK